MARYVRSFVIWLLVVLALCASGGAGVILAPSLEVPGVAGNINCATIPNTYTVLWYDTIALKTKSCQNGVAIDLSDVSAPGAGITSLNTLTNTVQTFATGTAGTALNISSVGSAHTFNIPLASAAATSGLMSNATQTFAGAKTFNNMITASGGITGSLTGSASDLTCTSCVAITELTFDPATQSELDAHTSSTAAHGAAGANVGTTNAQTVQNKTLDSSNIATLRDDRFTLQDNLDITKLATFQLASIPTGLSRSVSIAPSANSVTAVPIACTGTDKFRELLADGTFVCAPDAEGAGPGGGITSLNALTGVSQTFAVGTNGTDLNISSTGTIHTFNIPTASTTSRGLTTLGTGAVSAASGDDNRFASMQTPSALSSTSVLTCTKPTQYITGSGGNVTLTDAKWIADGTFLGQQCEICGSSAFSVTGPSTASVKLIGGVGSVVFSDTTPCQRFAWLGTSWRQSGSVNLQQAANGGNIIDMAGTQLRLRDGTSGFDFKVTAGIPTAQGICAGADCDHINFIPAGKNAILQGNGVEFERVTAAGVHTYSGAARPRGTLYWDAGAIKPDGTQCVPVSPVVNSGPTIDGITCADNAASKLSVKVRLPDRFIGPDIFCRLVAHDVDTLGHVLAFDARAQCRSPGTDVINATWSTPANVDITMTTANIPYSSAEVTITPNGTCIGGDMMYLEFNLDTATTTDNNNAVIEALTCEYLQGSRSD